MSIRYFATNRDREDLGRDIDRNTRLKLQEDGYHWVDMRCYMSHYLATTDSKSMPSSAIVIDSDETIFDKFLQCPAIKRIIIGIHGFNVPFHGALTSFSVLADTLQTSTRLGSSLITDPTAPGAAERLNDPNGDVTAFVGFSWPSDGSVLRYQADRTEAASSTSELANLICCIRLHNPRAKVHVIAHSMGNFLTCTMLGKLVNKVIIPRGANDTIKQQLERRDQGGADRFFIDRYVMLAPDVERRHVTQCDIITPFNPTNPSAGAGPKAEYLGPYHAGLKHLVEEAHLFYSRFDEALKASMMEKEGREVIVGVRDVFASPNPDHRWESSLGLNPVPNVAPSNMCSYNAVTLTNRKIDHGDYFDAPDVAKKIAEIILSAG